MSTPFQFVAQFHIVDGCIRLWCNTAKGSITKRGNVTAADLGRYNVTKDDVLEGMTAVVTVRLPEPQFEGQTKAKLGNEKPKGVTMPYEEIVKRWAEKK